jgi:hypothetical protein
MIHLKRFTINQNTISSIEWDSYRFPGKVVIFFNYQESIDMILEDEEDIKTLAQAVGKLDHQDPNTQNN